MLLGVMQLGRQTGMAALSIYHLPLHVLNYPFCDDLPYILLCTCPSYILLPSSHAECLLSPLHNSTTSRCSLAIKVNNDTLVVSTKPPDPLPNANTAYRPTPSSTTAQPPPKPSQKAASRPPRPPQPAKSRINRRRRKRQQRSSRARTIR